MSLSQIVHKFIEKEKLFLLEDSLLCSVSGGMDSMVMLDVLRTLGYTLAVGHVNYMLRGDNAHKDEALVAAYCNRYQLKFHAYTISPEELQDLNSGNLQEKARRIRYKWFSELMKSNQYSYTCVAHHQEDVAETFLYHAIRGAGLKGLRSIQAKANDKRRPLLAISKETIIQYAREFEVPYREDKSNKLDDYDRNYIRNKLLPIITDRWENSIKSLSRTVHHCSDDYALLDYLVSESSKKWLSRSNGINSFGPITEFKKLATAHNLAYHLLSQFDFNESQVKQILDDPHQSGVLFYSASHEAVYDRNFLLVQKRKSALKVKRSLPTIGTYEVRTGKLKIEQVEYIQLSNDPKEQIIDAASIQWPMTLRTWENGDNMVPLGMAGQHKKVSDVLTDRKLSLLLKRKQLVLTDKTGRIIWLIGQQLSEFCKLTKRTKGYLKLTWEDVD